GGRQEQRNSLHPEINRPSPNSTRPDGEPGRDAHPTPDRGPNPLRQRGRLSAADQRQPRYPAPDRPPTPAGELPPLRWSEWRTTAAGGNGAHWRPEPLSRPNWDWRAPPNPAGSHPPAG